MIEETGSCCCCPAIADVAGVYVHDTGRLRGQFAKTLSLFEGGTFDYQANFDLGLMISAGSWKVIPQGTRCFVQLTSNPEPVNPLINVHFDRTLLHLDGCRLSIERVGDTPLSFCRIASLLPEKA